jgi:hypothetical protein
VLLIPLKCPLSASLTSEVSLATRVCPVSPRNGESARGLFSGEMPGRGLEVWETRDTVLVRDAWEVWDVTEGEAARPL